MEVLNATTSRVQNTDGSFTASVASGPVWYQEAGVWKPVDITASKQTGTDIVFQKLPGGTKVTFDIKSLSYVQEHPSGLYTNTIGPAATFVECDGNIVTYVLDNGAKFQFILTRSGVKALTTVASGSDVPPTWKMGWDAKLTPVLDKDPAGLAYKFVDSGGVGRFWLRQPVIYDKDMSLVLRSGDVTLVGKDLDVVLSQAGLQKPFLFDPTSTFGPGAADGQCVVGSGVYGSDWAALRAAASSASVGTTAGQIVTTNQSGSYNNYRVMMPFDTSALPDNATVTVVTLDCYVDYLENHEASFAIHVVQTTQPSLTSLVTSDYSTVLFAGGGSIAYGSLNLNAYNTWTLDATGRSWVSLTGVTKLGLISNFDLTNTAPPTDAGSGFNDVQVQVSENANPPVLSVTYTVPASGDGGAKDYRSRQYRLLRLP